MLFILTKIVQHGSAFLAQILAPGAQSCDLKIQFGVALHEAIRTKGVPADQLSGRDHLIRTSRIDANQGQIGIRGRQDQGLRQLRSLANPLGVSRKRVGKKRGVAFRGEVHIARLGRQCLTLELFKTAKISIDHGYTDALPPFSLGVIPGHRCRLQSRLVVGVRDRSGSKRRHDRGRQPKRGNDRRGG